MKIVIVTGMSGAGKSSAVNFLEDNDYYCIDNMPPELLLGFADFIVKSDSAFSKIAVSIDIRSGELFSKFEDCVNALKAPDVDLKILFIDASDDTLVKRYKETRRKHPLDDEAAGSLYRAIEMERKETACAKELSDYYIDTSEMSVSDFKQRMKELFLERPDEMAVNVISFGFKHGIPRDADLVFDVRCLPNPFYIQELKHKTGLDDDVYEYVMNCCEADELFKKISELIDFLIPLYEKEGKSSLVIAFGCTGGKHRSVSFARRLSEYLEKKGRIIRTDHRHINV